MCGCETWSLTLKDEHMPRVFENRVLRKVCGPIWEDVKREWRKIRNGQLHGLLSTLYQILFGY